MSEQEISNSKPIVCERFADNGQHSHWEVVDINGDVLWTADDDKIKPEENRHATSLVYRDDSKLKLRVIIQDANSEAEALGKAIEAFEDETEGMALILKTVTKIK